MCGIAGILNFNGAPADPELVWQMVGMLKHRGPDDSGVYVNDAVGLGHARLSVIDLSGGHQPMQNVARSASIVFNGEIFNYVELREELRANGHRFATQSDTEVILALYDEYGSDCVKHLNGQWSFALWDAKRKRLFLSRDRLGVRPLYFAKFANAFIFASEIKSFLRFPGMQLEIDLAALRQIFTYWFPIAPRTVFRDVSELPPGHSITVENGDIATRRYWQLDYSSSPTSVEPAVERRFEEELESLLLDATRIRLRADVPVGTYLSGGFDSSIIAALARDRVGSSLSTFSVQFDDPLLNESSFQNEVAQALGTNRRSLACSTHQISEHLPEVIWHTERPILRTAPVPFYLLSKLVRNAGFKVILTGEGSDEFWGGYDIFKEVKIREFWAAQADSKRRPLLLQRLYPYLPALQSQPIPYLKALFQVHPGFADDPFSSHGPRWSQGGRMEQFFSHAAREKFPPDESHADISASLPEGFSTWKPFLRAQYLESAFLLPGYLLSSQGDRVAMAHSVEARYPFLDHRLVELSTKIPVQLKMKVLAEKYLLKRVFGHRLPSAVSRRAKQPYRAPDAASIFDPSTSRARHDYIDELLSTERLRDSAIFEPGTVSYLVSKTRAGRAISHADNAALIGILSTQLLIDHFILRAKEKFTAHEPANRERPAPVCN